MFVIIIVYREIVVNRHALPDRPVHSDTNSASLGSIGSDCHLSNGCLTLTPPGCQSRTMCVHCINLAMQGIPDQSNCQLNSVAWGGGHSQTGHYD